MWAGGTQVVPGGRQPCSLVSEKLQAGYWQVCPGVILVSAGVRRCQQVFVGVCRCSYSAEWSRRRPPGLEPPDTLVLSLGLSSAAPPHVFPTPRDVQ